MFMGRVVGNLWSTGKWPELEGLKLLLVRPYTRSDLGHAAPRPAPTTDLVVCADLLDAGTGDEVVVAFGHAARVAVAEVLGEGEAPKMPIDAAIVAIVDQLELAQP